MPRQAIAYLVVIILAGAGGILLAANLLKVQKSWSDALVAVKESNESSASELRSARPRHAQLESQIAQTTLGWDKVWDNVQATPSRQGTIAVALGSQDGLQGSAQAPQVLHAFQPKGNSFIYVGEFVADPIRENDCVLRPLWLPRPDFPFDPSAPNEVSTWQVGQWRFRTQIPAGSKTRFDKLLGSYSTGYATLDQNRASAAQQQQLHDVASEQLQLRNAELLGNPDAQEDPLRPELSVGLVAAMEEEEEARNTLQIEVDELRHQILQETAQLQTLLSEVRRLAGSQPKSPPVLGQKPD